MNARLALSMLLAGHLLGGCSSPRARCRVAVANACDSALASAVVRDPSGATYAFGGIGPHRIAPSIRVKSDLGATVILEAREENGVAFTNAVGLGHPVPRAFRGSVVFQVEAGQRVRAFVLPAPDGSGGGVLPWSTPPSWMGAPRMPGMPAQE